MTSAILRTLDEIGDDSFFCRNPTTVACLCAKEVTLQKNWPALCHLPTPDSLQARSRWRKMRIIIDIWRQGPLDSREKEHWTCAPTHLPATSSLDPGSIRDVASYGSRHQRLSLLARKYLHRVCRDKLPGLASPDAGSQTWKTRARIWLALTKSRVG